MPKGIYKRSNKELNRLKTMSQQPRKLRNGKYHAIHKWLNNYFGKANKCENPNCKGICKIYHYCLIKGKKHQHNRNNYVLMCASCHRLYDQKPEWIKKMKELRKQYRPTEETKRKISKSCKGINKGNMHSAKMIEQWTITRQFIKTWNCIKDAVFFHDINASGITMCAKGQLKQSGGFVWKYPSR